MYTVAVDSPFYDYILFLLPNIVFILFSKYIRYHFLKKILPNANLPSLPLGLFTPSSTF